MRICFLEGDMSRTGGTERMTAWLVNQLCREHQVTVMSLRMAGERVFFPLESQVTHQVLPEYSSKLGILKQIRWLHGYIKENSIDWVVNVDMGMGFYGILAAKGTRAKTITWEHGNFYNNWGSRLFPHMRRYAARRSDAVVVLTERDRENYQANISGCAPLYAIPNPATMREHTYDPQSKMILSVGHLLENKGYHQAVEVAAKLLPEHPDWQWVICGEGPERPRLEQMIRQAGIQEQMKLVGLVQDMDRMYRSAAMLVMTSEMEGLPMVLLEGKAYGLPLVAFDIMTGPSDIIDHGVNGYLVPPYDSDEMAERIRTLMDHDGLREEMSRKAIVGVEKFSEETIMLAWKRVFEK